MCSTVQPRLSLMGEAEPSERFTMASALDKQSRAMSESVRHYYLDELLFCLCWRSFTITSVKLKDKDA